MEVECRLLVLRRKISPTEEGDLMGDIMIVVPTELIISYTTSLIMTLIRLFLYSRV